MPYIRPDPKIDNVFQPPKIDTRQLTRNDIEKGLRTHRRMLIEKKNVSTNNNKTKSIFLITNMVTVTVYLINYRKLTIHEIKANFKNSR